MADVDESISETRVSNVVGLQQLEVDSLDSQQDSLEPLTNLTKPPPNSDNLNPDQSLSELIQAELDTRLTLQPDSLEPQSILSCDSIEAAAQHRSDGVAPDSLGPLSLDSLTGYTESGIDTLSPGAMGDHSNAQDSLEISSDGVVIGPGSASSPEPPSVTISEDGGLHNLKEGLSSLPIPSDSSDTVINSSDTNECGDVDSGVEGSSIGGPVVDGEHQEAHEDDDKQGGHKVTTAKTGTMEVDEGVEDAEEVEVAEDAADKEEEDEEGDDVIAKYVDKQEKMDEEALTFNKDDDDDDELPDFESQKPKKKSSKSSKENGVDDEKKKKKRRKAPDGKKKRVSRSTGEEKENKKATYQKDDILAKHVGPRVRSFDSKTIQKRFDKPKSDDIDDIIESRTKKIHVRSFDSKRIQKNFNRTRPASTQLSNDCKMCGKQVYQMEKIVAEKASWHKNCFRCKECNKNLTLETYQSHEGALYCKPHFKELFQPKAVIEDENEARKERLKRRPRMIVLENTPEALGEDVVRATDKPDYGLEELSSANVKQKFSMFENKGKEKDDRPLEPAHVRRSQSLMNKAARFLKEGDDEDSEGEYGVDNKYLGEYDDEEDEEEDDEEDEEEEEDEYEEIEVTDEDAEEEEEETKVNGTKVNGTKVNGVHDDENEEEDEDDEEKEDKEKDEEDKDEEEKEDEDEDEVKQNGFDEEEPKPKKKVTKIIKVKKEKVKKEKKEKKSRRERPMSIAGAQAGELKQQWESKNRRDKMRETRSKELSKFRAMLCAGKNTNLKEMFESGKIDNYDSDDERSKRKEQIKIERAQQARSIKDRFEKGEAFGDKDSDDDRNYTDERRECEEIFREAETARAARKRFNQIDSKVKRDGGDIMRTQSFANAPISNRRLSQDGLEATDAPDFGILVDPNYVRSSDKQYDENIDCARTKKLLDMFKKMEMQNSDEDERGPPPPRRFTPPPEGEEYDSEEYSDEEYTDDDDEEDYTDDEEEEEETDENGVTVPKYKDEVLEMKATQDKSPKQSARKAANLRAKFDKWENTENGKNNINKGSDEDQEGEGGARPSIDSARNIRKMFENKATEQPVEIKKPKHKVNRFVGGGGEKCVVCSRTVYALERLEVVGKVLHKKCFKCAKCKSTLGMGNFSIGGENYYCTTHYKQMFAEKGTYDVFTPNKGKWTRKIEASNGEAPKSQE